VTEGIGVTKINTLLRVVYTLALCLILSKGAFAQSTLNFAKATLNERFTAGFAVINPTSSYADVQFTYYGLDGNPVSSGLVNPVRYRVAPKGQVSMRASDLFAGSRADGWVQVTSATSGLAGYYLSGDFATTLQGAEPATPLSAQIVPLLREDQQNHSELVVVNPGNGNSLVTVNFFNSKGEAIATQQQSLNAHAAWRLPISSVVAAADNLSARITSSAPVSVQASIQRNDALLYVPGQPVDQPAATRVAPHFISGNGYDPVLVLKNPAGSALPVTVTLFGENGGPPLQSMDAPTPMSFTIPANGSLSLKTVDITGRVFTPAINGWLRVDTANVPMNGLLVLDQGQVLTAVPLETTALDRAVYSHIYEEDSVYTGFAFVNPVASTAVVDMMLVADDGKTISQTQINIPPFSKVFKIMRDVLSEARGRNGTYLFVHSSEQIYGVDLVGGAGNTFQATVLPGRVPNAYVPSPIVPAPAIVTLDPGTDVRPGMTLNIAVANLDNVTFVIADQVIVPRQLAPGIPSFMFEVPALDPGYVSLRVRSNGLDSAPILLHILPSDSVPTQNISGRAFYQKVDLSDSGLDLTHPVMMPIRNARVELVNTLSQSVVAVSETDALGRFVVPAPADPNLSVRVVSRLRPSSLRVADNTNSGALYATALDIDGRSPRQDLVLAETSRVSGAFNILEMIQRSNDMLKSVDPDLIPPAPTIFWSVRNTSRYGDPVRGFVGTSQFNINANTAYILGDRSTDSDEFDDPVIIHEYAHMLATKFSRDDSPGGPHGLGDQLDPRVAWSEGWANFFSSAVRNDPIWRDSGADGVLRLRYDLEDNVPAGDNPGYWSEASVDTILWDLFDDHADPADDVQYPFAQIWNAFADLRNDRFVYLPYFLEHFLTRVPSATDAVARIVQARSIDFQPSVRPSVVYPFPKPMTSPQVTGVVDSLSTKRNNLVSSAHFYSFTTTGGAASIRLDITGLGPNGNINANDLDLFLMDANGRVMDRSDNGLNGQPERIATRLAAGTYVVEIRSYYTNAETGGFVYNSGQYRLSVSVQ
jgi:hypothetical protein